MTQIYQDGTYLRNNPTYHVQDSPWKARQVVRMLSRHGVDPNTICEIGCGAGEVLSQLSHHYGDQRAFVGYEVSPQAFELCKPREKDNLTFFLSDPLERPNLDFDVILVLDVIEHVEDYFGFLRKLKAIGGTRYKLFHIPLDLSVQSILRMLPLKHRQRIGHLQYFTKETAIETLKETGYEIIDHFYTAGALETPNRSWQARLLNVPRRLVFGINRDLAVRLFGGYSMLVLAR